MNFKRNLVHDEMTIITDGDYNTVHIIALTFESLQEQLG